MCASGWETPEAHDTRKQHVTAIFVRAHELMASALADMLQNGEAHEHLPAAHGMLDRARTELQKIQLDWDLA